MSEAVEMQVPKSDFSIRAEGAVFNIINSSPSYEECPISIIRRYIHGDRSLTEKIKTDIRFKNYGEEDLVKGLMSLMAIAQSLDKERTFCGGCVHTGCEDYGKASA